VQQESSQALADLDLQTMVAKKRCTGATQGTAARIAELTTTRVAAALNATNADLAARQSAEATAAFSLGQRAELNKAKHGLEAQLRTELRELQEDEAERLKRIAILDKGLTSSQERITAATTHFDTVIGHIRQVRAALTTKEAENAREIAALERTRNEAQTQIALASEEHARRVMALWDEESAAVAKEVEAEARAEAERVENAVESDISSHRERILVQAKAVATALARQCTIEYANGIHPMIEKLETARSAHASVAGQLTPARESLAVLLHEIRQRNDPGTDLAAVGESFPLLSLAIAAQQAGAKSPDAKDAASSDSVNQQQRLVDAPPAGLAILMPQRLSSLAAASASIESTPLPPDFDVDAALEVRDAASLSLDPAVARQELHWLMEKLAGRWERLPGNESGLDFLGFLRATQHAIAGGGKAARETVYAASGAVDAFISPRSANSFGPSVRAGSPPSSPSQGAGREGPSSGLVIDVASEYRREIVRASSEAAIRNAEARVQALEQDRASLEAEIHKARVHDPYNVHLISACEDRLQQRILPALQQAGLALDDMRAQHLSSFMASPGGAGASLRTGLFSASATIRAAVEHAGIHTGTSPSSAGANLQQQMFQQNQRRQALPSAMLQEYAGSGANGAPISPTRQNYGFATASTATSPSSGSPRAAGQTSSAAVASSHGDRAVMSPMLVGSSSSRGTGGRKRQNKGSSAVRPGSVAASINTAGEGSTFGGLADILTSPVRF
jgi:hypothetical protein